MEDPFKAPELREPLIKASVKIMAVSKTTMCKNRRIQVAVAFEGGDPVTTAETLEAIDALKRVRQELEATV